MSDKIDVVFDRPGQAIPRPTLVEAAKHILAVCLEDREMGNAEVSVLFCSDAYIRRLNRDFLGNDKATDVLSFPALENPRRAPKRKAFHLGDLAISPGTCARQAPSFGRSAIREIELLLVHGFLHLIGYDHDTPVKKKAMWTETDRLLALAQE